MTDANERVLDRLYEDVWNGNNPATVNELVHDQYYIHKRELAEEMRGPELYRALATETRRIFPNVTFTIEDIVSAGDTAALRWTMIGTHEGSAFGVEPTGKQVELAAIEFNRFDRGTLVETWIQSDQLGLMEQIGALPERE